MARQLQSSFVGTVGNLTFYKQYNQYFVRTKSAGGVQTEATRQCQSPFAMAATLAAGIRKMLHPAIPNPTSKEMQNRLSKAVLQWLRSESYASLQLPHSISQVEGFQFISSTSLQQLFPIAPGVQISPGNKLSIHFPSLIPKQYIMAPPGTKVVLLEIASGSYCLQQRKVAAAFHHTIEIPFTARVIDEKIITTPVTAGRNYIVASAISVSFKIKQHSSPTLIPIRQHQWRASSIIDIRCS